MIQISLKTPISFSELGKRNNNEDCIFPQEATTHDKLFIVCDGVGGLEKGEIASELACESFANYFEQNKTQPINDTFLKEAFFYTEKCFDDYFVENPQTKGMGTTVVLGYIYENGIAVLHAGDSRFYQIRKGEVIFQTTDHTPINDLLRMGVITESEIDPNEKRSSKISRAIQGKSVKANAPEISYITDIQKDDIFFLCSDGVWDTLDTNFITLFQGNSSVEEIIQIIKDYCAGDSKDNFSAHLFQVEEVIQSIPSNNLDIPLVENPKIENHIPENNATNNITIPEKKEPKTEKKEPQKQEQKLQPKTTKTTIKNEEIAENSNNFLVYALVGIVVVLGIFLLWNIKSIFPPTPSSNNSNNNSEIQKPSAKIPESKPAQDQKGTTNAGVSQDEKEKVNEKNKEKQETDAQEVNTFSANNTEHKTNDIFEGKSISYFLDKNGKKSNYVRVSKKNETAFLIYKKGDKEPLFDETFASCEIGNIIVENTIKNPKKYKFDVTIGKRTLLEDKKKKEEVKKDTTNKNKK